MPSIAIPKFASFVKPTASLLLASEEKLVAPASKREQAREQMPETSILLPSRLVPIYIYFYFFYFFSEEKGSYFSIILSLPAFFQTCTHQLFFLTV